MISRTILVLLSVFAYQSVICADVDSVAMNSKTEHATRSVQQEQNAFQFQCVTALTLQGEAEGGIKKTPKHQIIQIEDEFIASDGDLNWNERIPKLNKIPFITQKIAPKIYQIFANEDNQASRATLQFQLFNQMFIDSNSNNSLGRMHYSHLDGTITIRDWIEQTSGYAWHCEDDPDDPISRSLNEIAGFTSPKRYKIIVSLTINSIPNIGNIRFLKQLYHINCHLEPDPNYGGQFLVKPNPWYSRYDYVMLAAPPLKHGSHSVKSMKDKIEYYNKKQLDFLAVAIINKIDPQQIRGSGSEYKQYLNTTDDLFKDVCGKIFSESVLSVRGAGVESAANTITKRVMDGMSSQWPVAWAVIAKEVVPWLGEINFSNMYKNEERKISHFAKTQTGGYVICFGTYFKQEVGIGKKQEVGGKKMNKLSVFGCYYYLKPANEDVAKRVELFIEQMELQQQTGIFEKYVNLYAPVYREIGYPKTWNDFSFKFDRNESRSLII